MPEIRRKSDGSKSQPPATFPRTTRCAEAPADAGGAMPEIPGKPDGSKSQRLATFPRTTRCDVARLEEISEQDTEALPPPTPRRRACNGGRPSITLPRPPANRA